MLKPAGTLLLLRSNAAVITEYLLIEIVAPLVGGSMTEFPQGNDAKANMFIIFRQLRRNGSSERSPESSSTVKHIVTLHSSVTR